MAWQQQLDLPFSFWSNFKRQEKYRKQVFSDTAPQDNDPWKSGEKWGEHGGCLSLLPGEFCVGSSESGNPGGPWASREAVTLCPWAVQWQRGECYPGKELQRPVEGPQEPLVED